MEAKIVAHLSKDEKLKKVIESTQLRRPSSVGDLYFDLIRSITFQQLSGKAAATIHRRFLDLFPSGYPYPEELAGLDMPGLRSVGISRQKAAYIQGVAEFFRREKLEQKNWDGMEDEEIIRYLTRIKGVGRWTVQMILMFTLQRPDVFPVDDLGIRQAMIRLYELEETGRALKPKLAEIAEPWRPYRSIACRYIWTWKDG